MAKEAAIVAPTSILLQVRAATIPVAIAMSAYDQKPNIRDFGLRSPIILAQFAEHRLVLLRFSGGSSLRSLVFSFCEGYKVFVEAVEEQPDLQLADQVAEFAQPMGVLLSVRDGTSPSVIVPAMLHPRNDKTDPVFLRWAGRVFIGVAGDTDAFALEQLSLPFRREVFPQFGIDTEL